MSCKVKINSKDIIDAFIRISDVLGAHETYLNDLDAIVGDGEHGYNVNKAFVRARDKLNSLGEESPGNLLKSAAMELIASGGGAGTTFIAMAIRKASRIVGGMEEIDRDTFMQALQEANDEIEQRGGAKPGDKTMIDALSPAVEAVKQSFNSNLGINEMLINAVKEARKGAEATKEMVGKKGRSVYAGERALGTPDPGATSVYLLLAAMANQKVFTPI